MSSYALLRESTVGEEEEVKGHKNKSFELFFSLFERSNF